MFQYSEISVSNFSMFRQAALDFYVERVIYYAQVLLLEVKLEFQGDVVSTKEHSISSIFGQFTCRFLKTLILLDVLLCPSSPKIL